MKYTVCVCRYPRNVQKITKSYPRNVQKLLYLQRKNFRKSQYAPIFLRKISAILRYCSGLVT